MPRKCPHCKADIIPKPISKLPLYIETEPYNFLGKIYNRKFNWEALKWKNINLMNLIVGDWINLIIILSVLFVAWAYLNDTEICREVYINPCDYVMKNIDACLYFETQKNISLQINPDLAILKINFTLTEEVS